MSSTRAAWYPCREHAHAGVEQLRIVRRPCAQLALAAGRPGRPSFGWSIGLPCRFLVRCLASDAPGTIAEAARRFADRTAYVAPDGWALTYADLDRITDEVAVGTRPARCRSRATSLASSCRRHRSIPSRTARPPSSVRSPPGVNDRLTTAERNALLETPPACSIAGSSPTACRASRP